MAITRGATVRLVASLAVVALAAAGCGGRGGSDEPTDGTAKGEPIIIGMDEDSTGPGASYSTIAGKTIRLAIQDINDKGGVLGRPLRLVVENDESDPTKVPAVLQKLHSQGAKALFLQSGSAAVMQAKSTLTQLGLPAIAPTGVTATLVEPPDNELIYMLANTTTDWADVYCGAFRAANVTRLGILTDDTATIAALNKALLPDPQRLLNRILIHLIDNIAGRLPINRVAVLPQHTIRTRIRHLLDQHHDLHRASTTPSCRWNNPFVGSSRLPGVRMGPRGGHPGARAGSHHRPGAWMSRSTGRSPMITYLLPS